MTTEDMAKAIERVLEAFSCPEIETVLHIGGDTVAIQAMDGTRFFLEVQNV